MAAKADLTLSEFSTLYDPFLPDWVEMSVEEMIRTYPVIQNEVAVLKDLEQVPRQRLVREIERQKRPGEVAVATSHAERVARFARRRIVEPGPRPVLASAELKREHPREYELSRDVVKYHHLRKPRRWSPPSFGLEDLTKGTLTPPPVKAKDKGLWWPTDWDRVLREWDRLEAFADLPVVMSMLELIRSEKRTREAQITEIKDTLATVLTHDVLGMGDMAGTPLALKGGWEIGAKQRRFSQDRAAVLFPDLVQRYTVMTTPTPYEVVEVKYVDMHKVHNAEDGTYQWLMGDELDEIDGE